MVMTATQLYAPEVLQRAEQALFCSPFRLYLFQRMREESVPLVSIEGVGGQKLGYTQRILSELTAEQELAWLIQVGLLRREVDGQGITDSFRLTPLGRVVISKWEEKGMEFPAPSFGDRCHNAYLRWFRLSLL